MRAATTTACPECDGHLRADDTETVCTECGLIVARDPIDRGPEWRSFADDERAPERTGAPLTRSRHDRGLSTEIGYSLRATGRKRRQWARLRRHHKRSQIATKAERNRVYAFTEIRRVVGQLDLPESVRDRACVLFESAQAEDLLRGRSLEGFAAAAVYAACRTASISRTLAEVTEAARATEAELKAAYDALNRELGLPTGPIDPAEYLARFASRLDLPPAVVTEARALVAAVRDQGQLSGYHPCGVAAACLYTAADANGYSLTQREAADVAGVTAVTVRTRYHEIRDLLDLAELEVTAG